MAWLVARAGWQLSHDDQSCSSAMTCVGMSKCAAMRWLETSPGRPWLALSSVKVGAGSQWIVAGRGVPWHVVMQCRALRGEVVLVGMLCGDRESRWQCPARSWQGESVAQGMWRVDMTSRAVRLAEPCAGWGRPVGTEMSGSVGHERACNVGQEMGGPVARRDTSGTAEHRSG